MFHGQNHFSASARGNTCRGDLSRQSDGRFIVEEKLIFDYVAGKSVSSFRAPLQTNRTADVEEHGMLLRAPV